MKSWVTRALRVLPAAALFAITVPAAAGAQVSDQQPAAPPPSYAHRVDTISGTISRFDGATTMYVRDARGYIDNVSLHKGTVINPTGIRLAPGFRVTISGHPSGSTFVADEIDTPYHMTYAYGYPYYPYPYYGPSIGLGFGFGGWHRW